MMCVNMYVAVCMLCSCSGVCMLCVCVLVAGLFLPLPTLPQSTATLRPRLTATYYSWYIPSLTPSHPHTLTLSSQCEPVFTSLLDCTQFFQTLLSPGENEGEGVWFGGLMCVSLLLKHFPKLSETVQGFLMDSLSAREVCVFYTTMCFCELHTISVGSVLFLPTA